MGLIYKLLWCIILRFEKKKMAYENDLNLKATELRLGLPGTEEQEVSYVRNNKKRPLQEAGDDEESCGAENGKSDAQNETAPPPAK